MKCRVEINILFMHIYNMFSVIRNFFMQNSNTNTDKSLDNLCEWSSKESFTEINNSETEDLI